MTAGKVCVSVAAGKPTTNWLTWRCQADCSKTVLLRPETINRRWLTVWTAESVNGSILQSGVLVDQTRRRHGPRPPKILPWGIIQWDMIVLKPNDAWNTPGGWATPIPSVRADRECLPMLLTRWYRYHHHCRSHVDLHLAESLLKSSVFTSFTAGIPLLTATSKLELGWKRQRSLQWCYLHHLHMLSMCTKHGGT